MFSFSRRKSGRSVECNGANRWLLTLLPVQLELFSTRNRHHRVCIRSFQLMIEPRGVGHRKSSRSVECNRASRWLLTLLPVQLELFSNRNRHHRVCVRSSQLLIEPKGACSHSAVGNAVDRSNATVRIDGCCRYYQSNSSFFRPGIVITLSALGI